MLWFNFLVPCDCFLVSLADKLSFGGLVSQLQHGAAGGWRMPRTQQWLCNPPQGAKTSVTIAGGVVKALQTKLRLPPLSGPLWIWRLSSALSCCWLFLGVTICWSPVGSQPWFSQRWLCSWGESIPRDVPPQNQQHPWGDAYRWVWKTALCMWSGTDSPQAICLNKFESSPSFPFVPNRSIGGDENQFSILSV